MIHQVGGLNQRCMQGTFFSEIICVILIFSKFLLVDGSVRVVQELFRRVQIVSVEGQMVWPDQGHSQVKLVVDIGPRGLHFCETQVFPTHRSDSNILVGGKWPNNVRLSQKSFLGQPPG